jgi:hypothetical protein
MNGYWKRLGKESSMSFWALVLSCLFTLVPFIGWFIGPLCAIGFGLRFLFSPFTAYLQGFDDPASVH